MKTESSGAFFNPEKYYETQLRRQSANKTVGAAFLKDQFGLNDNLRHCHKIQLINMMGIEKRILRFIIVEMSR